MSDAFVFGIGVVVSLIVCGAVSLLMWGASQEPPPGPDSGY